MPSRALAAPGGRGALLLAAVLALAGACRQPAEEGRLAVEELVRRHATAWETGDTALLRRVVHEDAVIAYPRRRLDRAGWIRELASFSEAHTDTRIYVHRILVDGQGFAVEWQFATTERASGVRTAVSDAIVGRVRDGRIVEWKEYLDARVPELQRRGELPLEEGAEPFPWPEGR